MSDVPPSDTPDDEPVSDDTPGTDDAVTPDAAAAGEGGGSGEPPVVVDDDDEPFFGNVEPIEIQQEMEQSFLDYAMSVIVSRALPDVRDGLKPVHRRILWGMFDQGVRPDRSHVKCARVVGDVMGKYHPHGDSAIYDALVRLGQPFSLRHPLIDSHGNFGSPADPPAAMRYTECRLSQIAMHLLEGLDEDTVDFVDNFDGQESEPTVLPARFPNFLVNGGQGIAVGMATNVPPHNLGEVVDATLHLIDNPEATTEDLMEFVKGPDFPTGGLILGKTGIRDAYTTGRGSIRMRAVAEIEEGRTTDRIVVTELPYQTSVEQIEQKAADLVNARTIEGIREIRNESAKGEIRLVFELKRDAPGLVILNNLYKYTPLQSTFSVNMVALVDGVPRTLTLRDSLHHYVEHQREVIRRRSENRLKKAKARQHIVEGLIKALDMIDRIIALIRSSEDRAAARDGLMGEGFDFSEIQANHILDLPLGRLTRLGRADLQEEYDELAETITALELILSDDQRLRAVIKDEMTEVRDKYANDRLSRLTYDPGDLDIEDLIDDEELVVSLSANGYVKAVQMDDFKTQGRGGRGVAGANLRDEDFVSQMLSTTAHAYLLFFTNKGRVYRLKAHQIPIKDRTARGTAIVNLLQLQPDESIQTIVDTRDYETFQYLFFATKNGTVKKTQFTAYDSSLKAGLIAINLRDDDELVRVRPTNGDDEVMLISKKGKGIRFKEDDVRPMGRSAAGVRGMRLQDDDEVVALAVPRPDADLLVVTSQGFGKRTAVDNFGVQGRGGQGVRAIKISEKKGAVAGAFMVEETDEIFLIGSRGVTIRTAVSEISHQGRDATGVRVMNVDDGSEVAAIARVVSEGTDEDEDSDDVDGDIDGVAGGGAAEADDVDAGDDGEES